MVLIWLGIGLLVCLGIVLLVQQRQSQALKPSSAPLVASVERSIFDLQLGDFVQYLGGDWVVEGRLTYDSNGYQWLEYLLQEGEQVCWLSVEEDDQLEVCWLEPISDLEISSTPPQKLTFGGEAYTCREAGSAKMTPSSKTLNRKAQRCQYFDYNGPGNKVLSVEVWDGKVEVTAGERISPTLLTILPGDGRRVYGV
ncbi:DUF4178 domain-containing protein [Leptolyngbya sp. FACHB-261]|nr:DUF4178 domain-containing protein [Leptolyngbya sp. FACHB-261]